MKKTFFLLSIIFLCLACDKEKTEENVLDVDCLHTSENDSLIYYSGLRESKLWFKLVDKKTSATLLEWTDTELTDKNREIDLGFGETRIGVLKEIAILDFVQTIDGFIVCFAGTESDGTYGLLLSVFNHKERIKKNAYRLDRITYPWYNASAFIGSTCYSNAGDTIYCSNKVSSESIEFLYPISYEEALSLERGDIERINLKTGELLWHTQLTPPLDQARRKAYLIDKAENIWKFKMDLVYFDGAKDSVTLSLNIDTGEMHLL